MCANQLCVNFDICKLPDCQNIQLSDPRFSSPVDLLIAGDLTVSEKPVVRKHGSTCDYGQCFCFGWILQGKLAGLLTTLSVKSMLTHWRTA